LKLTSYDHHGSMMAFGAQTVAVANASGFNIPEALIFGVEPDCY